MPDLNDDSWVDDLFTDAELDSFITAVHTAEFAGGTVDPLRVSRYGGRLTEALTEGFAAIDYVTPDESMLRALLENVFHFSAAKNRTEIVALSNALRDPVSGAVRTYAEFRLEALNVCKEFQGAWLKVEYELAVGASQMAARWADHSQNPDKILVYRTVGDKRVRPEHKLLNGIAKKVSDPFWKTYYPPNGWLCRCDVETTQRTKETPGDAPGGAIDGVPPMFRSNFAQEGLLFPKGHAYYKSDTPQARAEASKQAKDARI